MDLTHENFRAMIFYDFRVGLTQQECFNRLKFGFGDAAPSLGNVYKWYNEFKRGRHYLKDEPHTGRPKSAVVPETIDAVRRMIEEDRHITYREIEPCLGIGASSAYQILHEHLAVKKICSRWIPHNLTIAQKKARVDWCHQMLNKFNSDASKDVYKIVTGDES